MKPFYFNPERGWSPYPEGALLLLQQAPGQNVFYRLEAGAWVVQDPEGLQGVERGLLWKYSSDEGQARFEGLLQIDGFIRDLLFGLDPRISGEKEFFLPSERVSEFIERVEGRGGSLREVSGHSPLLQRAEALLRKDIEDLSEIEAGDHSRIPTFRDRGPLFQNLLEQALETGEPPQPFHEAIRTRAESERQLEELILRSHGERTPIRAETRLLALRELDWILSAQGVPCRWHGEELVLELPGGQVVLGEDPRVFTG